jgi:Putative adhesin
MLPTLKRQNVLLHPVQSDVPLKKRLAWVAVVAIASLVCIQMSFAQVTAEFHQTLMVTVTEPVMLDVEIPSGELQILYGRDGQVSISGAVKASADAKLDDNFLSAVLTIEQIGNHITIRRLPNPAVPEEGISVFYRIDVPYRTEVTSRLNRGKQNISGILGPVKASTGKGDIKVSYVSKGLQVQVDHGDLDLQVIGEHVEATARSGNISCTRIAQGVNAEAGDGDITLMVVGQSTATVKKGTGRIDVGGARGTFVGSTDGGDLHIKAIPHDDWQLRSASGSVHVDLPPVAKLELDVSTNSGALQVDRVDIAKPDSDTHHLHQEVNGGGKRIEVHTESGRIVIR